MHLRKINKKQLRSLFSHLFIPVQGCWWQEPTQAGQGTTWGTTVDRTLFHVGPLTDTHTYLDWGSQTHR